MKRVLLSVLAICMLFGFACAEVDLSGMSVDELVELSNAVTDELYSREGSLQLLFDGDYVVGKDIPEGDYIITNFGDDSQLFVWVYKSVELKDEYDRDSSGKDYHDYFERYNMSGKSHIRVSLSEGQVLSVGGYHSCTSVIAKAKSLFGN